MYNYFIKKTNWKWHKCFSLVDGIMVCSYNAIFSEIEMNGLLIHAIIGMNSNSIILSERS